MNQTHEELIEGLENQIDPALVEVENSYDVKIVSSYKDDGQKKTLTMNVDQIDQIKKLSVPSAVKKNSVDLGKLDKK